MGKILVSASHFDTLCMEAAALIKEKGHELIYDSKRKFPAYSYDELKKILVDVDAALIGMDKYDEEVFRIAPKLKAVAKFGVGVDNIDCESAARHGVKVINAPGQNSNAVAELTIGYILSLLRYTIPLHKEMEKGKWPRYIGTELKGKTVGLIGFGTIARMVAKKLHAFDVKILAYDLYPNETAAQELHVEMTNFDKVIAQSDILSLHIPATKENYHMFNEKTFKKMKKGSILINAARGAIVDLDSLAEALSKGWLAGAGLDAFEVEPLPLSSSILKCSNVILSPHTGAETRESYHNVSMSTVRDIISVLEGKNPKHWVNK